MVTDLKTKRKPTGAAAMGRGPGRPKGLQNRVTLDLKNMIETALTNAGGTAYLEKQAHENPAAFMTLIGKLLPKDVNASVQIGLAEMVLNSMRERD